MERNLSKNGLINAVALLAGGLGLQVLSLYEKSLTAQVSAGFFLVGFLVSLVSWFQMRLALREDAERLEVESLSNSRGDSALFSESAAETFPARRAREQFDRWLVPAFTVLLGALQVAGAWLFYRELSENADPLSAPDPTLALAGFAGIGLVLFLLGKYAVRLAQLEDSRLLRPGASAVLLGSLLAAVAAIVAVSDWLGFPKYDRYVAWILVGLFALVAVETLFALIFEIYRPRVKGKAGRLVYESRITGLLGQSGGLFSTAAQALDYQFGFKVSDTWFYKFLESRLAWLLLVWLGILAVSSCFVVIDPGQQGLLERFGRPVDGGVLDSGLHAKLPWPIDSVARYDTRSLQSFNVGFVPDPSKETERTLLWTRPHYKEEFNLLVASREQQAAATPGDQTVPVNLLTVSIPVQYLIKDVRAWAYNHLNANELIERIANREVVRYMASVDLDKIMSYGRLEASRDLQALIQKKADEAKLGVEIVLVGLQDIHPPLGTKQVQVAAAYEEVIGAIANKEAKVLAAEAYRAETLPKAAADAARVLNEARASALRRSVLAAGHAAQFTNQLAAYTAAPTVFRARTYLDTFAKAVGPARKLVIGPTNTSDVIIFNLEDSIARGMINNQITDPDRK